MTDTITTTPNPEQQATELDTPWTLHFDRDGTEDVAVIRDADGDALVTSRHFWRPEGDPPTPPTLMALRVMAAAPKLLEALMTIREDCRMALEGDWDKSDDGFEDMLCLIDAAVAEATDDSIGRVA